jgi:hypothetical protein
MAEKAKKVDMTTREFLNGILSGKALTDSVNGKTFKEKAEELLAAMDKRNAAKKEATAGKPSKTAIENEPIKKAIEEYLSTKDASVLCSEIALSIGQSVNKTSSLVRQMVDSGKVERIDLGRNKPLEYRLKRD